MIVNPSRVQRRPDVNFDTPPNTRMSIKAVGEDQHHWCTFVGLEKNRFLLFRLDKELIPLAIPGNRVTVKYILENLVFGFMTTVISKTIKPFPLLFLEYPQTVECLDLRHQDRAICFLPAMVYWQSQEYPGNILDISSSGCRIAVGRDAASSLAALEEGAPLFCQFNPDGGEEVYAKCAIRNAHRSESQLSIGVEFIELTELIVHRIDDYVRKNNEFRTSAF